MFLVNDKNCLTINADNYNILTKQRHNLHLSQEDLAFFSKELVMQESKFFIPFLPKLRLFLDNPKEFKITLKHFFVFTLFFTLWMNTLTDSVSFDKQYSMVFLQSYSVSMRRVQKTMLNKFC
jgi:hypothetical protein